MKTLTSDDTCFVALVLRFAAKMWLQEAALLFNRSSSKRANSFIDLADRAEALALRLESS